MATEQRLCWTFSRAGRLRSAASQPTDKPGLHPIAQHVVGIARPDEASSGPSDERHVCVDDVGRRELGLERRDELPDFTSRSLVYLYDAARLLEQACNRGAPRAAAPGLGERASRDPDHEAQLIRAPEVHEKTHVPPFERLKRARVEHQSRDRSISLLSATRRHLDVPGA